MGSTSSTRWGKDYSPRIATADCKQLAISGLRKILLKHQDEDIEGILTWRASGSAAAFTVGKDRCGNRYVSIFFGVNGIDYREEQAIEFEDSIPNFGGVRHWFVCSLQSSSKCTGRASKLFLPPMAHVFACRKCHNLTYRTSQLSRSKLAEVPRFNFDIEKETQISMASLETMLRPSL